MNSFPGPTFLHLQFQRSEYGFQHGARLNASNSGVIPGITSYNRSASSSAISLNNRYEVSSSDPLQTAKSVRASSAEYQMPRSSRGCVRTKQQNNCTDKREEVSKERRRNQDDLHPSCPSLHPVEDRLDLPIDDIWRAEGSGCDALLVLSFNLRRRNLYILQ